MLSVLEVPERFPAVLTGPRGADEPPLGHGDLVPPMLARTGDYVLAEDVWVRVTEVPHAAGDGYTVVPTVAGPQFYPPRRHAWVWAAADLAAHLARGGDAA